MGGRWVTGARLLFMARQFKCFCKLCVRTVYSAEYVCQTCVSDAKGVNLVLSHAREWNPAARTMIDPVLASRLWLALAKVNCPDAVKGAAELVRRLHTAYQLELGTNRASLGEI